MQNFIPFKSKSFEEFVTKEFYKTDKEIFSVEYEGEIYWIKKGRRTSSNIFHKIFYKLLPFEVLIPVNSKKADETIVFETEKLVRFKSLGIDVPEVLGATKEFFVLSDCGRDLYMYLKYSNISQNEFNHYLKLYIEALSKIHMAKEYHGGAQSRNFTYFKDSIYAIDLEDSFDKSVDIITLQFRDLLLMLLSMSKIRNYNFSYKKIILEYIKITGNESFKIKLKELGKKLGFLLFFYNRKSIRRVLSRDIVDFLRLIDELQKV